MSDSTTITTEQHPQHQHENDETTAAVGTSALTLPRRSTTSRPHHPQHYPSTPPASSNSGVATTYNVLSSNTALTSSSLTNAQLMKPASHGGAQRNEAAMRFTGTGPSTGQNGIAPVATVSSAPTASTPQNSIHSHTHSGASHNPNPSSTLTSPPLIPTIAAATTIHPTPHQSHRAELERQEREVRQRMREERIERQTSAGSTGSGGANGGGGGGGGGGSVNMGLVQRKHSVSISSRSHNRAGSGGGYNSDPPPMAPPIASLHRSPSFEKRLIDSARFAGTDLIEEDEEVEQFTCAALCRGSCCGPTNASGSHNSSRAEPSLYNPDGTRRTPAEIAAIRMQMAERPSLSSNNTSTCHRPTWDFMFKILIVLVIIASGIVISIVLYQYLHHRELVTFRNQMSLLCLERSNTIQSQLNFSMTVMKSHVAIQSLLKNGSATGNAQGDASNTIIQRYASISQTVDYLNFLLYCSLVRSKEQAVEWEASLGTGIAIFGAGASRRNYRNTSAFTYDAYEHALNITEAVFPPTGGMLPIDWLYPPYPTVDLRGWDIGPSGRIFRDLITAASLNEPVFSNRSTLLLGTSSSGQNPWGFVVTFPLYSTLPLVPDTLQDRLDSLIGGLIGIIPLVLIVERAMSTLDPQPINLIVYDRSVPPDNATLYIYQYEKDVLKQDSIVLDQDEETSAFFDYGTRSYEVLCQPTDEFVQSGYSSTPLLIGIGAAIIFGILLIMVVLVCLYTGMRRAITRSNQLIHANRNKNLALDLLHEAKRISDDANRSKSDFLAFLCHELRNPLHAIVAMIDFLQTPDDDIDPITGQRHVNTLSESQQESIDTIQNSVKMMSTIVNDALDMSKIEAGKITFEILPMSIIDLINSLVLCERPRADAKGIKLEAVIGSEVPKELYGDPTRIRQVCSNLLSNSIKFTSSGSVTIEVKKITMDSFVVPMSEMRMSDGMNNANGVNGLNGLNNHHMLMQSSIEEAGESKFQSDMSRTVVHTQLGTNAHTTLANANNGGGSNASNDRNGNLGGSGNSLSLLPPGSEYHHPPGATPAMAQRRLGQSVAGVEDIDEELSISESTRRKKNADAEILAAASPSENNPQEKHEHTIEMTNIQPVVNDENNNNNHAFASSPDDNSVPLLPRQPSLHSVASLSSGSTINTVTPYQQQQQQQHHNPSYYTHGPLPPSNIPSAAANAATATAGSASSTTPSRGTPNATTKALLREVSSQSRVSSAAGGNPPSTFTSENVIIEISVTDTGMGIDPTALPLLFEPYSQAKLSVMRSFGGTGLGLAIVKQIVSLMQGSISVKSQVGEGGGTTMTIRLPLPTAPSLSSVENSSGEVSQISSHISSNSHGSMNQQGQQQGGKIPSARDFIRKRSGSANNPLGSNGISSISGLPFGANGGSGIGGSVEEVSGGGPRMHYHTASSSHLDTHTYDSVTSPGSGNNKMTTGQSANALHSIRISPQHATHHLPQHLQPGQGGGLMPTPQSYYSTMDSTNSSLQHQNTPPWQARFHGMHGERGSITGGGIAAAGTGSSPVLTATSLPSTSRELQQVQPNGSNGSGGGGSGSGSMTTRSIISPNGQTQMRVIEPSSNYGDASSSINGDLSAAPTPLVPASALVTPIIIPSSMDNPALVTAEHENDVRAEGAPIATVDETRQLLQEPTPQSTPTAVVFHQDDSNAPSQSPPFTHVNGGDDQTHPGVAPHTRSHSGAAAVQPVTPSSITDVHQRLAALATLPMTVNGNNGSSTSSSSTMDRPATSSFSSSLSTSATKPSTTLSVAKKPLHNKPLSRNGSASGGSANSIAAKNAATLAAMSLLPLPPASETGATSGALAAASSSSSASSSVGSLAALAATRTSNAAPTLTPIHARDLRILIADDSLTNLKILARMLNGFQVTQAINGAEACEKVLAMIVAQQGVNGTVGALNGGDETSAAAAAAATTSSSPSSPQNDASSPSPQPPSNTTTPKSRNPAQFDLIFSDIVMPVKDGHEAAREIRRLERHYSLPPVPLVALTANAFMEDRERCAKSGFSFFISKPYKKSDIISLITLVCSQMGMQLVTSGNGSTSASASPALPTHSIANAGVKSSSSTTAASSSSASHPLSSSTS